MCRFKRWPARALLSGLLFGGAALGCSRSTGAPGKDPVPSDQPPVAATRPAPAAAPALRAVWSRRFGGADFVAGNQLLPVQLAVDAAGNTVLAGSFRGSVDFGHGALASAGGTDVFLAKLDPDGTPLWSRRFGSPEDDVFSGVAVSDAGQIALAGVAFAPIDFGAGPIGSFRSAIVLVTFSPAGEPVWQREYGQPDGIQFAYALAADGPGNLFLAGRSEGPIGFGPLKLATRSTPFLVKLNTDASPAWGHAFGGAPDQAVASLRTDRAGNLFFVGDHEGSVIDGVVLPRAGETDLYAGRFACSGALGWAATFGDGQLLRGEIAAQEGDLFMSGPLRGTADFGAGPLVGPLTGPSGFLVRFGPRGELRWQRAIAAEGKLGADGSGNLSLAGTFTGQLDLGSGPIGGGGDRDVFIAGFDAGTGELRHAAAFGDGAAQSLADLRVDGAGAVVVAGVFAGALDFGAGALVSAGAGDLFVAKLAP